MLRPDDLNRPIPDGVGTWRLDRDGICWRCERKARRLVGGDLMLCAACIADLRDLDLER